jgi:hypothetical protein
LIHIKGAPAQPGYGLSAMIAAMIVTTLLVALTILVHYEILRITSAHLSELPIPPRARIVVVVGAAFVAHTVEVWLYGFAYWLLVLHLGFSGFAGFAGQSVTGFEDCLYFSAVTYTSLGFGDLYPVSHARLIAGVESLNGLVLIGWSASFTYLAMSRYWPLHEPHRRRVGRGHHARHADPASAGDEGVAALTRRESPISNPSAAIPN